MDRKTWQGAWPMTDIPVPARSRNRYIAIFLAITAINTVLALAGILAFPVGPGISALYIAVAFEVAFALWFGMYGAIAAYCGGVVSGLLMTGLSLPLNLVWSLSNLWQVLLPLLAVHLLKADISLKSPRDLGVFLVSGVLLNNLAGALWGTGTLLLAGSATGSEVFPYLVAWFLGNVIVTLVITPVLLRYGTPAFEKRGVLVPGFWG